MKLELNKRYKLRNGNIVIISKYYPEHEFCGVKFPYHSTNGGCWQENGQYITHGTSEHDIVEEALTHVQVKVDLYFPSDYELASDEPRLVQPGEYFIIDNVLHSADIKNLPKKKVYILHKKVKLVKLNQIELGKKFISNKTTYTKVQTKNFNLIFGLDESHVLHAFEQNHMVKPV